MKWKGKILVMEENNITIEQIKDAIRKLKLEIIEKENKIDELLKIIDNEEELLEED